MASPLKKLLYVLVLFNAGLVLVTWLLSAEAVNDHPQQGRLIAVGDTALHVIDSGQSPDNENTPTVVLLHGASTSAQDFTHNLHTSLAKRYRVVSIDRPGHGYSERGTHDSIQSAFGNSQWMDPSRQARLILQALETLDIKNPVVLGHSWAGSVVLAAMLQTDAQVHAGILLAGATHPWIGEPAWHVKVAATPVIGTIFSWQYIAPLGRLMMPASVADVLSPDPVPENYIENTGLNLSLRPQVYQNNAEDLSQLSDYLEQQAAHYSRIRQPILSIVGSEDDVVPSVSHHDKLAIQLPRLQTLRLAEAGHAPHHTQAELVYEAIVTFVDGLPAPQEFSVH